MTPKERINACIHVIRAMRVLRWTLEWPAQNSERPNLPAFVRAWETEHGPAPASAQSAIDTFNIGKE